MNIESQVYIPTKNDGDDKLVQMIKSAILNSPLGAVKREPGNHDLHNMITSLEKSRAMPFSVFERWCELLNLSYRLSVEPKQQAILSSKMSSGSE